MSPPFLPTLIPRPASDPSGSPSAALSYKNNVWSIPVNWHDAPEYRNIRLTGVKTSGYELENMDYQAKLNEEMAQRNQQRQNEYFGMTAEYNSAKNQKQRLIDAGLNPALMYGRRRHNGKSYRAVLPNWYMQYHAKSRLFSRK
jgi:hypothetical protein